MDFDLSSEQADICRAVRDVAARFTDDYWRERDARHEFPWEFYAAMAAGGWLGIAIPERYGGGGLGTTEAGLLLEEVAASGAAMNGCSAIHLTIFGLNPVVRHGSPELQAAVLPRAAAGDLHVSFAVTEPDAGTDTSAITTSARRHGAGYLVSGRKVWTSKAQVSEKMLLLTRTASAPRAWVSATCWTASTPSAFCSPMNPSASAGRRVERYFREARLIRIAPVSQEMTLSYLAAHVLGLPRSY